MSDPNEAIVRWLNRTQVATLLGIHPNSLYKLERRADFPKRSLALGSPRWRSDELHQWMENGRAGEDAEHLEDQDAFGEPAPLRRAS
jgi:predicted DNA-binding transcriptional regulator AlpA